MVDKNDIPKVITVIRRFGRALRPLRVYGKVNPINNVISTNDTQFVNGLFPHSIDRDTLRAQRKRVLNLPDEALFGTPGFGAEDSYVTNRVFSIYPNWSQKVIRSSITGITLAPRTENKTCPGCRRQVSRNGLFEHTQQCKMDNPYHVVITRDIPQISFEE